MTQPRRCPVAILGWGVLILTGCGAPQPVVRHVPREVPVYDAETLYETITYTRASFSHDETRILLSSDQTGVFNVYSLNLADGRLEPMTRSARHSMFAIGWFPHDDRALYSADQDGNELTHIFVREITGKTVDLTPGKKTKAEFLRWSGDRRFFYIATNERDPKHFDVYRYSEKDYTRERIFENKEAWSVADISRDGRWIALDRIRNNVDSDIYLWDVWFPEKPARHVTPHQGQAEYRTLTFTPDCRQLVYATDAHGEYRQGWAFDMITGEHRALLADAWDVMFVGYSETGRYRVHAVNADARTAVTLLDRAANKPVELPKLPSADITGMTISRSENWLAFYVAGDASPADLHLFNLQNGEYRQLTRALNPKVDPKHLVTAQVVRYPSFDGLLIPALLYRPWNSSPQKKAPALVWVHGGPGGQSRHGYNATIQHLVNHGYGVLAVNNRGSSGYGKRFYHLDDRNHGEGDLKDCIWGRRYLEALDWVDGSRIGIIGGSYGGFMVAAALTREPEAFDVGINIFGVTNWLRTLNSIPPWWSDIREALFAEMGDPKTDEPRLRRISPLENASRITRPMLVVQGANDPRVLKVESDDLVAAARKNGVPVEYLVFPDEGHGFLKKKNRIAASEAYVKFLREYLTPEPPDSASRPTRATD